MNTLLVIACLADEVYRDRRVLSRYENPCLMDGNLTTGRSRSSPVVTVYDESCDEVGWWGPWPSEIQAWVMEEGLGVPSRAPADWRLLFGRVS